ncbi:uncharacterized protein LOC105933016 isoform X1 [Fundulus heteroclitus]|uniref:uncharacterized protein LOC105933016 isoform X1 n=1 Tax=Fundulus heteroclitus TaxID=8078 RepID=UPI00165C99CF|nr:uncharacterized protein LOC105933016 isoform X1 [Fundulus heteroclitus]
MTAVWVCAILCLCCTAEMKEVVWKEVGESITIKCRGKSKDEALFFYKGITDNTKLARVEKDHKKKPVFYDRSDRVQIKGKFPNIDFLLENLNVNDTAAYRCVYLKKSLMHETKETLGDGSLLLVVKENNCAQAEAVQHHPDEPNHKIPLVYVVPVAVLLPSIILGCVIWRKRKTKSSDITVEQTCVATSTNVYEDEEPVEAKVEVKDEEPVEAKVEVKEEKPVEAKVEVEEPVEAKVEDEEPVEAKVKAEAEVEAKFETVSMQDANPAETVHTSDHSLKSDMSHAVFCTSDQSYFPKPSV